MVNYEKNEITLIKPIKIDGEETKCMKFDIEKLTISQYIDATAKGGLSSNKAMELNASLHFLLGAYAISNASNNAIDITDIQRVIGRDNIMIAGIGRDMFKRTKDFKIDKKNSIVTFKDGITYTDGSGKKHNVKELKYDFDSITNEQFTKSYDRGGYATNKFMELNDAFHVFLGAYVISNVNPDISISDIENSLHGKDVILLATLGRNFFTIPAEDTEQMEDISQPKSSEEQCDPTQEPLTQD